MYQGPDQSWRQQPHKISSLTVSRLASRLREYANVRRPQAILVIAHGGEPLLLGASGLRTFFSILRNEFEGNKTKLMLGIQTNATLVTDEIIDVLQHFQVRAGVSIDGPPEMNDCFRLTAAGKSSYSQTMNGLRKLMVPRSGKSVFGGVLGVINPAHNPREVLAFHVRLGTPSLDFLLPDYNHDTYPQALHPPGIFGRWLVELFDAWFESESEIDIRLFRSIIRLHLGASKGFDSWGASSNGVLIVETDGTYHALDVLKTSFAGATRTGRSVTSHSISSMESYPMVMALSAKRFSANKKCLECQLFEVCGGGYLPHRYSAALGFDRESVYCDDLYSLISHIRSKVSSHIGHLRALARNGFETHATTPH